ncbi:MAG: HAMP domain-containing sensor histidine kinase [Acidobacteriota bacterium]
MNFRPRTVRLRLTLWYAAALAVIVLIFATAIYLLVETSLFSQLDRQLSQNLSAIESVLPDEPDELSEVEEHGSVHLFQVRRDGRVIFETEGWKETGLQEAIERALSESAISRQSPGGHFYRVKVSTPATGFTAAVAEEEAAIRQTLKSLRTTMLIGLPCALLLALASGYFLARRVLSPVRAMAAKAEEITAERLSERLPAENPEDEFGRLATVFNQTLSRLEESFQTLRRFTADASHELRTPLTALRSVGEVGLRDHLDPESSREVIGSMLEETDRLARLVDSLLTLTRADSGKLQLNQETVDLIGLVEDVADHLHVLAEERNQTLSVKSEENGIAANVDRSILRQAIVNLLDNAIKYTRPGGTIRLSVKRLQSGRAAIEFIDQGPGIPPEHQEKIFERFYRIEKGRSRETGGLGLTIARWAVEANGGRIELESKEGHGSVFRILLPVQETTRTGPPDFDPVRKGGYK